MVLEKHPKAEALIFDLDGTLSDSLPVHIATWHKVCSHYNCKFNEKIIAELTGMPTIRFAERIIAENGLSGVDPHEMVKMKQETFWEHASLLKPHQPVIDFMKSFHGKIPLAVGTGASRKSAEVQLETLGITHYFDAIVTADDVSHHKPEPETFLKCAELVGVKAENCQVLEDGVLGMEAAKTAGMYLIDVRPITYQDFIAVE